MPKTLYLSSRELATVIDALTLYAAVDTCILGGAEYGCPHTEGAQSGGKCRCRIDDPDSPPPATVRTGADRAFAAILAGYARRVSADDAYDADRLRDQWYAHLRPDLTNPPAKTEAKP